MRVASKADLVGVWEQRPNRCDQTSVVYTIQLSRGRLTVKGVDTADNERLRVSGVRWAKGLLRFKTLCRSTKWRAEHLFEILSPKMAMHQVTYEEDGKLQTINETWRKKKS